MKRIDQRLKQKWDCSQIEEDIGDGDVFNWYDGDKMVGQRQETSNQEENIAKGKMVGESPQVEGVQRALELLVSQVLTKRKVSFEGEEKGKVVGWSTEKME